MVKRPKKKINTKQMRYLCPGVHLPVLLVKLRILVVETATLLSFSDVLSFQEDPRCYLRFLKMAAIGLVRETVVSAWTCSGSILSNMEWASNHEIELRRR